MSASPQVSGTARSPIVRRLADASGTAIGFAGVGLAGWALWLLFMQVVDYMRYGIWLPRPASDLFGWWDWFVNPESWFGVHRLVSGLLHWLSVPVLMWALCPILFGASMLLEEIAKQDPAPSDSPGHPRP